MPGLLSLPDRVPRRSVGRLLVPVLAGLLLSACGGSGGDSGAGSPAPASPRAEAGSSPTEGSAASDGSGASGTGSPPPSRPVTKLLVFVVENHSFDQMRAEMPSIGALAERYGYASDYSALTHPSLANYIAMVSGDLHGVDDDAPPSEHPLTGSTVFGRALEAGHTAGVFADGMPFPCVTENEDKYVVRHNPWTYFVEERPQCEQYDVPMTEFPGAVESGELPDAGMVVPDVCHDGHNCALKYADQWMDEQLRTVSSGPDWRSGHLAVVVTADEDDDDQVPDTDNHILTVVLHPSQDGNVVDTPLDHYSLYGLYEDVLGLPHEPTHDGPSMAEAFGLPLAE